MLRNFDHPAILQCLLALPVLVLLVAYSNRRLRVSRLAWGTTRSTNSFTAWPRTLAFLLAVGLLILSLARPGWGDDPQAVLTRGRDLALILDLSRSMAGADMKDAKQPERWQAARESIRLLLEDLKKRGGPRVSLTVFAATAVPLCPLTVDYDFVLSRLDELSVDAPPLGVYPGDQDPWTSGTRFGAAIVQALESHDRRLEGYQDCIIISDGDDPGADRDAEVAPALAEAAERRIPVHAVAVGDNVEGAMIFADGQPVRTMPDTEFLREVARRTNGLFLDAGREMPDLAGFYREKIEPRPSRELPEEALPQRRNRAVWFILPALALLLFAWWKE